MIQALEVLIKRWPRPEQCEHRVNDGDYCPACNQAYKDAAADPENTAI